MWAKILRSGPCALSKVVSSNIWPNFTSKPLSPLKKNHVGKILGLLNFARSCSLLFALAVLVFVCSSSLLLALPRSCSLVLAPLTSFFLLVFLFFEHFAEFVVSFVSISFLRFRFSPFRGCPPYLHFSSFCLSHDCFPSHLVSSFEFFGICSG